MMTQGPGTPASQRLQATTRCVRIYASRPRLLSLPGSQAADPYNGLAGDVDDLGAAWRRSRYCRGDGRPVGDLGLELGTR